MKNELARSGQKLEFFLIIAFAQTANLWKLLYSFELCYFRVYILHLHLCLCVCTCVIVLLVNKRCCCHLFTLFRFVGPSMRYRLEWRNRAPVSLIKRGQKCEGTITKDEYIQASSKWHVSGHKRAWIAAMQEIRFSGGSDKLSETRERRRLLFNAIHQNRDTFSPRKRLPATSMLTFRRRSWIQASFGLRKPYLAMMTFRNAENLTQFPSLPGFEPDRRHQVAVLFHPTPMV